MSSGATQKTTFTYKSDNICSKEIHENLLKSGLVFQEDISNKLEDGYRLKINSILEEKRKEAKRLGLI